jgi:hypothetical protein
VLCCRSSTWWRCPPSCSSGEAACLPACLSSHLMPACLPACWPFVTRLGHAWVCMARHGPRRSLCAPRCKLCAPRCKLQPPPAAQLQSVAALAACWHALQGRTDASAQLCTCGPRLTTASLPALQGRQGGGALCGQQPWRPHRPDPQAAERHGHLPTAATQRQCSAQEVLCPQVKRWEACSCCSCCCVQLHTASQAMRPPRRADLSRLSLVAHVLNVSRGAAGHRARLVSALASRCSSCRPAQGLSSCACLCRAKHPAASWLHETHGIHMAAGCAPTCACMAADLAPITWRVHSCCA